MKYLLLFIGGVVTGVVVSKYVTDALEGGHGKPAVVINNDPGMKRDQPNP